MSAAAPAAPVPPKSLLPFAILIGGQLLSFVGTTLTGMGIGIWVFERTGSVVDFAWLTILTLVPAILISPFGGVIADRWPKKPAMLAVDALAAASSVTVLGADRERPSRDLAPLRQRRRRRASCSACSARSTRAPRR